MPNASQVTVTGKVGPDRTVTAQVLSNVTFFGIDTANEILKVIQGSNDPTSAGKEFDISAASTITVTVSGNTYTVSIS